ncbi:MAG: T9SS type A sorting domain-containing protein [Flavobacteriales bacterium]|nr:T9SS type A sorting domain-containing protein [Flavobacteriales bacterium]
MKKLILVLTALQVGSNVNSQVLTEVSQSVGIYHHAVLCDNDMSGQGGAAWFDYNNDGWYDLYLTGGSGADALYRNNGDGTFSDQTSASGISVVASANTDGVTTGDFNRDGWNDIFVTTFRTHPNYLFMNNGDGTFAHVIEWAGKEDTANSFSSTFGDLNMDGWLDLFVCNWSRYMNMTLVNGLATVDSEANFYYENNADGTFTSKASLVGIDDTSGCGLGVIVTDFDNDHDPDLFVSNDFGFFVGKSPNRMFRNDGPSVPFVEVSHSLGLDMEMNGMGVARTDVNADGVFDYYTTNIRDDKFMVSSLSGYEDELVNVGLHNDSVWLQDMSMRHWKVGWGVGFLDIDNDMDEDVMIANGSLSYDYPHPALDSNKLYINDGFGNFTDVSFETGVADTYVSRALAYCDYDKDGDLDVFVGITDSIGGTSKSFLYRNDSPQQNWLQVKAVGVQNNTNGIGTKVIIYVNGQSYMREIGGESSFSSQHWQVAHFGLAQNTMVDSVDVIWYGGGLDRYRNVTANQMLEVVEGQGMVTGLSSSGEANIDIYPNPCSNNLTVAGGTNAFISMFDSRGQLVEMKITQNAGSTTLDVSGLSAGNYFLKVKTEDGRATIRKVVKQ